MLHRSQPTRVSNELRKQGVFVSRVPRQRLWDKYVTNSGTHLC